MSQLLEAFAGAIASEDESEGRIYGFLYGVVKDIGDPKGLGRIRARIGAQGDTDVSDWLLPLWPGAMESVPRVGDSIVVCFIDGNPNRGMYACHATTNMQGRATDYMLLGSTFARLYNDLVAKFNTLKSTFNTHNHGASSGNPPVTTDTDPDAAKALAADGSQPSALASNAKVLSGEAKVR